MDCELWTVDCGLWAVDCGLWTVDCGLWLPRSRNRLLRAITIGRTLSAVDCCQETGKRKEGKDSSTATAPMTVTCTIPLTERRSVKVLHYCGIRAAPSSSSGTKNTYFSFVVVSVSCRCSRNSYRSTKYMIIYKQLGHTGTGSLYNLQKRQQCAFVVVLVLVLSTCNEHTSRK